MSALCERTASQGLVNNQRGSGVWCLELSPGAADYSVTLGQLLNLSDHLSDQNENCINFIGLW